MYRSNWVLLGFLVIVGFFLLTEHRAHALGVLPFLLLLVCLLLYLFHHGKHGAESKEPEHTHRDPGELK